MKIIMGGLFAGNTKVMDGETKKSIQEHWHHVNEASGQPFDYSFFDRQDFVYDTEPGCRAVVAARRLDPDGTLAFLDHLHHAFYAENQNLTHDPTLCDLAASAGLNRDDFAAALADPDVAEETRRDFAIAYHSGVTGFPTLIAGENGRYATVTQGFQTLDRLRPLIDAWANGKIHIQAQEDADEPTESS